MEQWDHNNHYHQYLLNQLPSDVDHALDIGCGYGGFACRLARRSAYVDAVDVEPTVVEVARQKHTDMANIKFIHGDFVALNLPSNHYQVVTSLAAVHHMDLAPVLGEMKRVLKPGGVLVILGLYREATIGDYTFDIASVIAHAYYSRLIYRSNTSELLKAAPVMASTTTLAEIKTVTNAIIPEARIRRHLLWRYSLIWEKT